MTEESLNLWIMDSLMEGEEAVRHLFDYINRGEVGAFTFVESLRCLRDRGYIEFTDRDANKTQALCKPEIERVLREFDKSLDKNDSKSDIYYNIFVRLSDAGDRYVASKGLHL